MTTFAYYHPICTTIIIIFTEITLVVLALSHGGVWFIGPVRHVDHFEHNDKRKMP
jgi:hypothetical protein